MFKKIAAFGAHPDDIEIGCFGTVNNFAEKGATVELFIATGDVKRSKESLTAFSYFHKNIKINSIENLYLLPLNFKEGDTIEANTELKFNINCFDDFKSFPTAIIDYTEL